MKGGTTDGNLLAALTYVLQPYHIGVVFFGTLIGILVGAMPGLSSIMGLSIHDAADPVSGRKTPVC